MKRGIALLSVLLLACVVSGSASMDTPKQGKEVQEGTAPAEAVSASDEQPKVKLCEALPGQLGEFIKRTRSDALTAEVAQEAVESLSADHPDLDAVLDMLQPKACHHLAGAVTLFVDGADEGASTQTTAKALIIAATNVTLAEDVRLASGETLVHGDVVQSGLIVNAGDSVIWAEDDLGNTVPINPTEAATMSCAPSCSVGDCAEDHYACCWVKQGCAHCRCLPNGTSEPSGGCDGGGPGAGSCSVADKASASDGIG